MGKHRALEAGETTAVENRRLIRVWTEYCQPFYKRYRKGIVAVASAVFTVFCSVYTNGISPQEWILIITTALGAAGVISVPNETNKKVVKNDNVQ